MQRYGYPRITPPHKISVNNNNMYEVISKKYRRNSLTALPEIKIVLALHKLTCFRDRVSMTSIFHQFECNTIKIVWQH